MTPNELLYTEQEYVFIVPPPFDAARILNGRVDKYSTIVIGVWQHRHQAKEIELIKIHINSSPIIEY